MRLTVITITCRANPRFREMASSLLASFRRAPADTHLDWIIIDDGLWTLTSSERLGAVDELWQRQTEDVRARFTIGHYAPPMTVFRGPNVSDPLPAHNSAKNRALDLMAEHSQYVCFLSDCTVVTGDWVTVMTDAADKGVGWRCKTFSASDQAIPEDLPFKWKDSHDLFHPVQPTAVAGPAWGCPSSAIRAVGGFDASYDGEDDYHDHEAVLRLGRTGLVFVTTNRANALRLSKTKLKADVTTRAGALRAARNQGYYNALVQDRRRIVIPPTAAQVGGDAIALQQPGGASVHASAASLPAMVAPGSLRAPRPAAAPAATAPVRYAPPRRPAAQVPAPARTEGDWQPMGSGLMPGEMIVDVKDIDLERAPLDQPPYAQHASEICGVIPPLHAGDPADRNSERFWQCVLVKDHAGGHHVGAPAWIRPAEDWPRARIVAEYKEWTTLCAMDPAGDTEGGTILDDLWYVMTDGERDQVDPAGAAARKHLVMPPAAPEPAKPVTLHERAKAADLARKSLGAAIAAGTAPVPAQGEQCGYTPSQGTYRGRACIKRKHGSAIAHQYHQDAATPPPPPAQRPQASSAPREAPAVPRELYPVMSKADRQIAAIITHLEQRPLDVVRQVVSLSVVLRREGVVPSYVDFQKMIEEAIPFTPGKPIAPKVELRQQALPLVMALHQSLPPPACTPAEMEGLARFALQVDQWRASVGIPKWGTMALFNRAYQIAADLTLDIVSPDDFEDGTEDGEVQHERRVGQSADLPMQSVEPLTDDEAQRQQQAVDDLLAAEARRLTQPN